MARLPERKPVRMRVARAQKVHRRSARAKRDGCGVFKRLGLPYVARGAAQESFVVTPPSYRFDLEIEEDLIEEVARLHGFERIAAHPPRVAATMLPVPETRRSLHALRDGSGARATTGK